MATVYFGSRSSERMYRIYEKCGMGDDVFLRFEVEYKGNLARSVGELLADYTHPKRMMWAELQKLMPADDPQAEADVLALATVKELLTLYEWCLGSVAVVPRAVHSAGNTEKWLLETVLPALDRFLNEHGQASPALAERFLAVVEQYC